MFCAQSKARKKFHHVFFPHTYADQIYMLSEFEGKQTNKKTRLNKQVLTLNWASV